MTGVEITLILVGIIFVLVSFFVQEKLTPKDVQEITRLSEKELKIIVERELKNANDKVEDAIDAVVEQSQENAKRLKKKRMRKLWQSTNIPIR
jgi:ferritin-like metal-binding protein YciE